MEIANFGLSILTSLYYLYTFINTTFIANCVASISLIFYVKVFLPKQALLSDYNILVGNKFLYIKSVVVSTDDYRTIYVETTQSLNRMLTHQNSNIRIKAQSLLNNLESVNNTPEQTRRSYIELLQVISVELGYKNMVFEDRYVPKAINPDVKSSTDP